MNCVETARLLNAHADLELDLADSIAVEEHLDGCAGCRRSFAAVQAVRAAISRHGGMPPAPLDLRRRLEREAAPAAMGRSRRLLRSPFAAAIPGVLALVLAGWLFFAGSAQRPAEQARVVYHIANSETATAAMRNLGNHLAAAPEVKIIVVAHNSGVDFLLSGARDEAGRPFEEAVRGFSRRGVQFRVCHNTLERRGITAGELVPGTVLVPSGIAEIGRLQTQEGFAYLRF